ncbi:hypothetical protein ARMGADRAFT_1030112 [Armillaria gallica]|uniref:Zinc finger RING-type eukaryotic domain-containing protein n=1 Tax=Armillaria gallica TaxID=47427 RepID=A0A2H3DE28_ARMGA|nr:hypothetical protein ARMGADRAFT_1030112 [Armillaria gallica]
MHSGIDLEKALPNVCRKLACCDGNTILDLVCTVVEPAITDVSMEDSISKMTTESTLYVTHWSSLSLWHFHLVDEHPAMHKRSTCKNYAESTSSSTKLHTWMTVEASISIRLKATFSTITGINTIKQDVNQNQGGKPDKNQAQSRKKGRRAVELKWPRVRRLVTTKISTKAFVSPGRREAVQKVEDELAEGEKLMPEEENQAPSTSSTLPLLKANTFPRQCRLAQDRAKLTQAKAEEIKKENEQLAKAEVQRKKDEECQRQEETRIHQEEEQRRIDEEQHTADAQWTHQCIVFGSIVTFSPGFTIQNIIAGFNCCNIRVKNIPRDACPHEVRALFIQQGLNISKFHVVSTNNTGNGKQDVDVVTTVSVVQTLAVDLEGMEFRDERLEFEIGTFNQPGGMGVSERWDENTLTISCQAPSATYIVEYPDMATCHSKVAELNGHICSGRKVKADMNHPPPGHFVTSFWPNTIKISNLPVDVPTALIRDFSQSKLDIRTLKSYNFDIDAAFSQLESHIDRVGGVKICSFEITSQGNTGSGVLSVRVCFDSWESANEVGDLLVNQCFDFIGKSFFWFKLPPQELYTIIIPQPQYRAQAILWMELQESIKDRKACNLFIHQMPLRDFCIQVSGAARAAIGALKVRVERLAAGEKFNQWHQHLVRPPVALMERIRDAGYFLHTGLSAMKEIFREDSVTLDIRLGKITIRGGEEIRLHLNNHITESLKAVSVRVAPGINICPICYDEASTPFQLVCWHVYCTACLWHFLTSAAETGVFPLVCMGNNTTCGTPISIPVIQKFLPQNLFEHLLETVFTSYVDKQPQVFGYCKTLDCKSCEDAQLFNNTAEQERLSEAWIMQQSRIKKCPSCSRLLDKIAADPTSVGVAWVYFRKMLSTAICVPNIGGTTQPIPGPGEFRVCMMRFWVFLCLVHFGSMCCCVLRMLYTTHVLGTKRMHSKYHASMQVHFGYVKRLLIMIYLDILKCSFWRSKYVITIGLGIEEDVLHILLRVRVVKIQERLGMSRIATVSKNE